MPAKGYKETLQERTVERLRQAAVFLLHYQTLPMGTRHVDGFKVDTDEETKRTNLWLKTNEQKLKNEPTTAIRAALVKLGVFAPRGDEAKFEAVMPDFLKDTSLLQLDDAGGAMNVARSPRSKAKELTPNPFPSNVRPGGGFGSPFKD